VQHATHNAV